MKIKFKEQDTICIDDIDPKKHIVAAIIRGKPTLARARIGAGYYVFSVISESFTSGNSFALRKENKTIYALIKNGRNIYGEEIKFEVFESKDWKKALKWLMDNA